MAPPVSAPRKLLILGDINVQDPRPSTLADCLGREYLLHRVSSLADFDGIPALEAGTLRYLVVACMTSLIGESSTIADADDRELTQGKLE